MSGAGLRSGNSSSRWRVSLVSAILLAAAITLPVFMIAVAAAALSELRRLLSAGATDSAPLRSAGVLAYGLLPFPLTEADEGRMHGHDERVSVASLAFAVRLEWEILRRITGA